MVITGFSSNGWFEKRLELSPSRISFCIPMTISRLTPVVGLFLTRNSFEKIFKTQGIFKIKERFQVLLE